MVAMWHDATFTGNYASRLIVIICPTMLPQGTSVLSVRGPFFKKKNSKHCWSSLLKLFFA